MDGDYSNRELETFFSDFKHTLSEIRAQVTKTNGRVTKLEKYMLIVGTALIVVIALKFPELLVVLKMI
jgi:hypothetical protein